MPLFILVLDSWFWILESGFSGRDHIKRDEHFDIRMGPNRYLVEADLLDRLIDLYEQSRSIE